MRGRRIGLVLGIALLVEIVTAVIIVELQPGGFRALFQVDLGPEHRQDIPAKVYDLGQNADITINNGAGQIAISADPNVNGVQISGVKIVHSDDPKDFDRLQLNVIQEGSKLGVETNFNNSAGLGISPSILLQLRVNPSKLAHLNAHTGSGNVSLVGLQNPAALIEISTGSGDLQLNTDSVQKLDLRTGSGTVEMSGITAALQAQTGSGDIRLNADNSLTALNLKTGSGDIRGAARLNLTADGLITTGSGEVDLRMLSAAKLPGFFINASSGDIKFNLKGVTPTNVAKHHLETGGSPLLNIHTGSGDITIS